MTGSRLGQLLLNVATGVATICAAVVAILWFRDASAGVANKGPATTRVENWREIGAVGNRVGPAEAVVTVVEFIDFQCGYCRLVGGSLRQLQSWYGKDLAVVYRHLPVRRFAHAAAHAAECAARVGRFEPLHDILFAQPDSIGTKPWTRFAYEAGVADTVAFSRCLDDPSVDSIISRDSSTAMALGASGTPTLLVNDLMVVGNPGFDRLDQYVRDAKARAKP